MSGNVHVRLREKGGGQKWPCCTSLSSSMGSALSFLGEYANMILMRCGALHLTFVGLPSSGACVPAFLRNKPLRPKTILQKKGPADRAGRGGDTSYQVRERPGPPDERSTELHPYSPGPCTSLSPGGWPPILDLPISNKIPGSIRFSIKVILFLFLYIWVRAAFPRYRYDQLMGLGRKVFLPLSLARVVPVSGQLTSIGPGDEPILCDEGWMQRGEGDGWRSLADQFGQLSLTDQLYYRKKKEVDRNEIRLAAIFDSDLILGEEVDWEAKADPSTSTASHDSQLRVAKCGEASPHQAASIAKCSATKQALPNTTDAEVGKPEVPKEVGGRK
ncbi:hypothetical protein L1987_89864 [Smallanthus sonchifolius]|nr:hypothetical protein L1987_89864 [Smallanthus sonchifolius]